MGIIRTISAIMSAIYAFAKGLEGFGKATEELGDWAHLAAKTAKENAIAQQKNNSNIEA